MFGDEARGFVVRPKIYAGTRAGYPVLLPKPRAVCVCLALDRAVNDWALEEKAECD